MKNRREYHKRLARKGSPSVEDATNNPDDINEDQNEDFDNGNGDNSTD
jgi:hypothetical protein